MNAAQKPKKKRGLLSSESCQTLFTLWLTVLIIHEVGRICKHATNTSEIFKRSSHIYIYVCFWETEREQTQCMWESSCMSVITTINSFPLFPLSQWVSAHTAAALSIWSLAKDTCRSTTCAPYLCIALTASAREPSGVTELCVNPVLVFNKKFTHLPAEHPTAPRRVSRERQLEVMLYDGWTTQPLWVY